MYAVSYTIVLIPISCCNSLAAFLSTTSELLWKEESFASPNGLGPFEGSMVATWDLICLFGNPGFHPSLKHQPAHARRDWWFGTWKRCQSRNPSMGFLIIYVPTYRPWKIYHTNFIIHFFAGKINQSHGSDRSFFGDKKNVTKAFKPQSLRLVRRWQATFWKQHAIFFWSDVKYGKYIAIYIYI